MGVHWIATLALGVFFSLGAVAGPSIGDPLAAPEPNRFLNRVPLVVEIDPAELAKFSPEQRAQFEALKFQIAQELSVFTGFNNALPRPVISDGAQMISLKAYFNPDAAGHVERMAVDEEGKRKRFTAKQKALFEVSSTFANENAKVPGQFDLWEIRSKLLHKGEKEILLTFQKDLARGLWHITVKVPEALVGDSYTSAVGGFQNIIMGIYNSVGLIVGLPDYVPTHSAEEVQKLLDAARTEEILEALKEHEVGAPGTTSDLRLAYPQLLEKAQPIVAQIWEQADAEWTKHAQDNRVGIAASLIRRGSPSEDARRLANSLEEAKQAKFFEAIAASPELEAISPGLGVLIVRHGRALTLIEKAKYSLHHAVAEYRKALEETLRREKPIRSQIPEWLQTRLEEAEQEQFDKLRGPTYEKLALDLESEGLHQEAVSLRAGLYFTENEEGILKSELEAARKSGRVYKTSAQIWQAKNWVVEKTHNADGSDYFSGRDFKALPDIYSAMPFHRVALAAERSYAILKGGLYWLAYRNWWNGPIGMKSLFLKDPFTVAYKVDSATGKIVPSEHNDKMGTLLSRFHAIQAACAKGRADFEARPDKSELPKWLTRIPNWVGWNIFGRVFGTTIASGGQLALTLGLNGVAPVYAAMNYPNETMAALAVVPVGMAVIANLFSQQIYDVDHSRTLRSTQSIGDPAKGEKRNAGRWFPMAAQLEERVIRRGVIPLVAHGLKGIFWDGMLTTGTLWAKGWGQWMGASLRDWAFRSAFFAFKPKIPAQDPGLFFRRVKGNGVANGYFYQVDRGYALGAQIAQLELMELGLHRQIVEQLLDAPEEEAREFFAASNLLVTGSPEVRFSQSSAIVKDMRALATKTLKDLDVLIEARQKALLAALPPQQKVQKPGGSELVQYGGEPIKLTQAELELAVPQAALLTQRFFETRTFPQMSKAQQDAFWTSHGLTRGDWMALSLKIMKTALGDKVLVPIETTEAEFHVGLTSPGMTDVMDSVLTAGNFLPNGEALPVWSSEFPAGAPPAFKSLTGHSICARGLAEYGHGMGTLAGTGYVSPKVPGWLENQPKPKR
jgi:hypothetical protein